MYQDERNEYGCPLRNQTGAVAIRNFVALLDQLSPDMRAEFEGEREERQAEIESYVADYGYRT